MREILFRGKRIDNGEWIYGDLQHNIDAIKIRVQEISIIRIIYEFVVRPETVGQYTGIKDANGIKVFEGDISRDGLVVCWSDMQASFVLAKKEWMYNHFFGEAISVVNGVADVVIIGNIHDYPELLKDGERE